MEQEIYRVYNLDNRVEEIWLDNRDYLSKNHCKRCGSRIVVYSGDPHNVAQCPVCKMYPPTYSEEYSDEREIEQIEQRIINMTEELIKQTNLLKVVKKLNAVREKNNTDKAMKGRE